MNGYSNRCPEDLVLFQYLLQELSYMEVKSLEEHFCDCDLCCNRIRMYSDAYADLQSLKARAEYGKYYKNTYCSIALLPAAASDSNSGISETRSEDGKYLIRLIPFLHTKKSLLEVHILDGTVKQGNVIIENEDSIIFEAPLVNGVSRDEVQSPVDLRHMFIRIRNND